MLVEVLSVGAIDALVPVLIIVIFIGAAAGISRGFSFFNLFGIGTLMGMGPKGKGSLAQKTYKKAYVRGKQKPLKVNKKKIEDKNKDKEIMNDFNRYFKKGKAAATIAPEEINSKGAGQLKPDIKKSPNKLLNTFEKGLILTSPLVSGAYYAGKGFIKMATGKDRLKKVTGVVYKYKDETLKLDDKDFGRYTNRGSNMVIESSIFDLAMARRKISNEKQKIMNDTRLSQIQKKLLLANLSGLDRAFSKRLNKLENSFDKIYGLKRSYEEKITQLTLIKDQKEREKKAKEIDQKTFEEFSATYKKLFNTNEDFRTEQLKSQIEQLSNQKYGAFKYKFVLGGITKDEEPSGTGRRLLLFNLGREKLSKKEDSEEKDEAEKDDEEERRKKDDEKKKQAAKIEEESESQETQDPNQP